MLRKQLFALVILLGPLTMFAEPVAGKNYASKTACNTPEAYKTPDCDGCMRECQKKTIWYVSQNNPFPVKNCYEIGCGMDNVMSESVVNPGNNNHAAGFSSVTICDEIPCWDGSGSTGGNKPNVGKGSCVSQPCAYDI